MSLPKDGGDPGQSAAPGAGGRPREGSRDIRNEGKIVSVPDDWCKSTDAIVPYPIWAWQSDASDLANTVRQTDNRSHVRGSVVTACHGDEAGTGGGLFSRTHNGACTPKTWSETVRFEGRNAVRHDDEWLMNNGNTWGRLDYTKKPDVDADPPRRSIDARMPPVARDTPASGQTAATSDADTVLAQGATPSGAMDLSKAAYTALAPGGLSAKTKAPGADDARPKPIPNAEGGGRHNNIVRVSGGCDRKIGTYGQLRGKCGKDNEAHHVPPDWTMGLGRVSREKNVNQDMLGFVDEDGQEVPGRIANMPTFRKMPAICVEGKASEPGSEHNKAQVAADIGINDLGGQDSMVRLKEVLRSSVKETGDALRLSEECRQTLQEKVDEAFKGIDRNQLVRGSSRDPADQPKEMDWLMHRDGAFDYPPSSYWK